MGPAARREVRLARLRRTGKGGGPKGPGFNNILKGLCTCLGCGTLVRYRSARNPHLQCESYRTGRGCTNKTHYDYPKLERAVLDHLMPYLFEIGFERPSEDTREIDAEVAVLSKEIMRPARGWLWAQHSAY